jgi:hypothetical protein
MTQMTGGQGMAAALGGQTEAAVRPLAEPEVRHDLLVLAILSTLLAFASISTIYTCPRCR